MLLAPVEAGVRKWEGGWGGSHSKYISKCDGFRCKMQKVTQFNMKNKLCINGMEEKKIILNVIKNSLP